jgi:hypothetical protein
MPHSLRIAADSKTEAYINTPTQIAQILLESFDKSALALFRRYLDQHPQVRKWIIADFALHGKNRPLDCFAFTILPYDAWPAEIEKTWRRRYRRTSRRARRAMKQELIGYATATAFMS